MQHKRRAHKKAVRGPGRPPLPKDRKRSRRTMVNLTENEFLRLMEVNPDESASNILRDIVINYLARRGD